MSGRELLVAATRRELRRKRSDELPVVVPPVAAIAIALALTLPGGHGVVPALVFAALAAAGVLLHVRSLDVAPALVARRLDRAVGGRDLFLTIATAVPATSAGLFPFVETMASSVAAKVPRAAGLGRMPRGRILAALLSAAGILALALALSPPAARPLDPVERLGAIADRLRDEGPAGAALAARLDDLIATLEDPAASAAAKQAAIESLREATSGGGGEGSGGEGEGQGTDGTGTGAGGGAGEASGDVASALGELEDRLGGGGGSGAEGGVGKGEAKDPRERGEGEGESKGGEGERSGDAERPGEGDGEGKLSGTDPRQAGGEEGTDRADAGEGRGTGSEGHSSLPGERFFEPGEGPAGWRLGNEGGVLVWIPPSDEQVAERERVPGAGEVRLGTTRREGLAPGGGPPGAVRQGQPLPLEYRGVLGEETNR